MSWCWPLLSVPSDSSVFYSLSLSLIPGQGGGSPPQSVPGSPIGVVGPCWTVLPARCPFWPAHELDNGGPGAPPSRQRRCSMDRCFITRCLTLQKYWCSCFQSFAETKKNVASSVSFVFMSCCVILYGMSWNNNRKHYKNIPLSLIFCRQTATGKAEIWKASICTHEYRLTVTHGPYTGVIRVEVNERTANASDCSVLDSISTSSCALRTCVGCCWA